MWAVLLLQTSILTQPLYLEPEQPSLRTARNILLLDSAASETARSRPATLELARDLVTRLRGGCDFEELAREYSQAGNTGEGAVLGTFALGMLAPALDHFLFSAAVGDVSDPLEAKAGVHILKRVDTHAAVLQIQIAGTGDTGRARSLEVLRALEQGADFAELARQHSSDRASAARGGQFAIYERGPNDTLVKAAAFQLKIGEVSGPIESSVGWHIIKRVAVDDVDPKLGSPSFVRLRAILVRFDVTGGPDPLIDRNQAQARKTVDELHQRIVGGADMRSVAREFNDDPGGKEREGDLGWIYRYAPSLGAPLRQAVLLPVGELSAPTSTSLGYLIVRREK